MNLKEQQYICTIAECGSITKAAEKLFITQPALSLYISNLEKTLGIRLFDRVDKQFLLTAAGYLYVEKARKMLELQQEFEAQLYDLKNYIDGELSIGVQLRRAPLLLPPAMARFRKAYPNIKVTIREGVKAELENFLAENRIQLLIYNAEEEKKDLCNVRLYEDKPLLAIHKDHPLNRRAVSLPGQPYPYLDLEFCRDELFILPTKRQSLRVYVDKVFSDLHIRPGSIMEIRNFETAMGLVNEGYGLGFNREQYKNSMTYLRQINYYLFCINDAEKNWVFAGYKRGRDTPDYLHKFIEALLVRGQEIKALSIVHSPPAAP